MARYIDIDDDRNCYIGNDGEYERYNIDPDVLNEAVEIIRCKDCKHFIRDISCVEGHYDGCDEWTDNGNEIMVAEDDFCSYAERRTDE